MCLAWKWGVQTQTGFCFRKHIHCTSTTTVASPAFPPPCNLRTSTTRNQTHPVHVQLARTSRIRVEAAGDREPRRLWGGDRLTSEVSPRMDCTCLSRAASWRSHKPSHTRSETHSLSAVRCCVEHTGHTCCRSKTALYHLPHHTRTQRPRHVIPHPGESTASVTHTHAHAQPCHVATAKKTRVWAGTPTRTLPSTVHKAHIHGTHQGD